MQILNAAKIVQIVVAVSMSKTCVIGMVKIEVLRVFMIIFNIAKFVFFSMLYTGLQKMMYE